MTVAHDEVPERFPDFSAEWERDARQKEYAAMRRSFTLVEMLVVIAIIGVLAALLMPALQSALDSARTTQCMNHLRQFGIVQISYQQDFDGFLMATDGGGRNWMQLSFPYVMNRPFPSSGGPDVYRNTPYQCPSRSINPTLYGYEYAINEYLVQYSVALGFSLPLRANKFRSPGGKIFLSEYRSYGNFRHDTVGLYPFPFQLPGGNLNLRHMGEQRVNVAFLDGNARTLGAPPLPLTPAQTANWLVPTLPPPSGL